MRAERPSGTGSFIFVKTKAAISQDGLPKNFLNRFGQHVTGEFALTGIRNADLRALLYQPAKATKTAKGETRLPEPASLTNP